MSQSFKRPKAGSQPPVPIIPIVPVKRQVAADHPQPNKNAGGPPVVKYKRNAARRPGALPVQPAGTVSEPGYVKACVDALAGGDASQVRIAVDYIIRSPANSFATAGARFEIMRDWIDAIFANPDAAKKLYDDPKLFANVMMSANALAVSEPAALGLPPNWLANGWLADKVKALPDSQALAHALVGNCWREYGCQDKLDPTFRKWLVAHVDVAYLNRDSSDGGAARLLSLLWNAGDVDTIVDLVANKQIDIMQPATATVSKDGWEDGVFSGFVQPLGHLIAEYVWLVHLADTNQLPALKNPAEEQLRAARIDGARKLLKVVSGPNQPFLTTYKEVLDSDLVRNFQLGSTVWGFENVRMPFVHALRGKSVLPPTLRMMDLWDTVRLALVKGNYAQLLATPDKTIPELVKRGVADFRKKVAEHPEQFVDYQPIEAFIAQCEVQCTTFLEHLAKRTPLPKFASAGVGQDYSKHLGSFGCIAGLYWAKETKAKVYYCIDGVNFKNVTDYKRYKTKAINMYMTDGAPAYTDAITLSELREIVRHWEELKDTVVLVHRGAFVQNADELMAAYKAELMASEDKDIDGNPLPGPQPAELKRLGPAEAEREKLIEEYIKPLGLEPAAVQAIRAGDPRDVMHLACAIDLIKIAARAKTEMLDGFLELALADVLFDSNILPQAFKTGYKELLAESDPKRRDQRVEELTTLLFKTGVPSQLAVPLEQAIRRVKGPTTSPGVT